MLVPSQARKRPEWAGVWAASTSIRWLAARSGLNSRSAGTERRKGAERAVAVVPGCSKVTQAWGSRRSHSRARQRSSWFWAALAAR